MDYTDEHLYLYTHYVNRTATLAPSTGVQTLAFQSWFLRTYKKQPGSYLGLVGTVSTASPCPDDT